MAFTKDRKFSCDSVWDQKAIPWTTITVPLHFWHWTQPSQYHQYSRDCRQIIYKIRNIVPTLNLSFTLTPLSAYKLFINDKREHVYICINMCVYMCVYVNVYMWTFMRIWMVVEESGGGGGGGGGVDEPGSNKNYWNANRDLAISLLHWLI